MTPPPVPRPCPVCGGTSPALLYRQRFEGMTGDNLLRGYDVAACGGCGMCYADDIPDQAAFDRYYRDMSKYEYADRGGQETDHDRARFRKYADVIREFLPGRDARILEVGCATGGLLAALRDLGYPNLVGLDPSPACAAAARRLYGVEAAAGTLADLPGATGPCDVVITVGVMEHVRDLGAAVGRMAAVLPVGGRAFVSVPDASRYTQGEDAPYQEFSVEHINYFGPASLDNLMGGHGFRPLGHRRGMTEFSHKTLTPVLHAGYEKDGVARPPARDEETARDLAAYVEQSAAVDRRVREVIDRVAAGGGPVVVWGTGAHTLRLLATSRLADARVVAYVDSNPHYQGRQLRGVPIVPPAALAGYDAPILISSRVYQTELVAKIRDEMRLPNPVLTLYDLG